ncbi:MAG: dienelactone hydrolase family protein [Pseudomonadota bacterium]|nr:dienelactone hydrolase family protein [Pseudomonadota bacterium]
MSGAGGSQRYVSSAKLLANLGYDVVLLDGNRFGDDTAAALKQAVEESTKSEHALAGKAGVIGCSLGGGKVLTYATRRPEQVAVVVAMFPKTSDIADVNDYAAQFKVPVLMLAGEADTYLNCCLIGTARAIAAAAAKGTTPFQLVTYPGADHDFVVPGRFFNSSVSADAWVKTASTLKQYLPAN